MAENRNVAAMREALMDIVLLTVKAGKSIPSDVACGIIASKAKHALAAPALAAPARNCDRYATWDKAWDAFSKSYFGPTDPGELEYHFGVWLFAKEGGAP